MPEMGVSCSLEWKGRVALSLFAQFQRARMAAFALAEKGSPMQLNRLILSWNGPMVVGGGVTVLHFEGAEGAVPDVAAIKAAFTTFGPNLPNGCTVTIPNTGDVIEDTTGALVNVWTGTSRGTIS